MSLVVVILQKTEKSQQGFMSMSFRDCLSESKFKRTLD
nr:unnamed protein product [Callosobruchus chinensis]